MILGCGGEDAATARGREDPPAASPGGTEAPASASSSSASAREGRRHRGVFYSLTLPPGATIAEPSQPEIVEALYAISPAEGVMLTVFRPMPLQNDLDEWTDQAERLLDGVPTRHDDAEVSGLQARVAVFPGELRWTVVADGEGLLFKCFSPDPHDENWMHAHCDEVMASVALVRAIE